MAGEEVAEPPQPVVIDLLEFDEIHRVPLVSAVSPPPKTPWSMVAIRNHQKHGHKDPPIIFPPVDHENLHIRPDLPSIPDKIPHIHAVNKRISFSDSDSDSDSNSSSSFSPSDSSLAPRSPLIPAIRKADATAVSLGSWTETFNYKVNRLIQFFCSMFTFPRGVFSSFRSAAFTAVLVAFLYFRRRRRSRAGQEGRERLIGIIKEKDELTSLLAEVGLHPGNTRLFHCGWLFSGCLCC